MLTGLLGPTSGDNAMLALFTNEALIKTALDFESALAEACAEANLIDQGACRAIVAAARDLAFDGEKMTSAAHHAGTLAIPLVAALRADVARQSAQAAELVHLGSTSQDVLDTVTAVHCRQAAAKLITLGQQACDLLAELAERHSTTPMIGRTLLRQAMPITFGLKAANWLGALADALTRVSGDASRLGLQYGGAVGTLAGLDDKGREVAAHLAARLNLPAPEVPWQTNRTSTVTLGASLAVLAGVLSKLAGDIALLGQDEIGEVAEANAPGRGGSSAMPNKRNPVSAQQILAATNRLPALAQTLLSGMRQEHERGLAGWQIELPVLAEMFAWTYDALTHARHLLTNLEVDTEAMARNLEAAATSEGYGAAPELSKRIIQSYRSSQWTI